MGSGFVFLADTSYSKILAYFEFTTFRMTRSIKITYRSRVMILLYFLMLILYLDRVTVSMVGVRIKSAFHLSNTQFGWVLSSFVLAYALFEIPSGVLGDRLGQRKVLLRIVIWWSVFTALTGCVFGLTSLIAVRFLFGMGEAGAYPNSCGVISRWMPKSETSRGMSWLGMGAPTGFALAPLVVIPIAIAWGWRAPFFINGMLGLIWVLICWLWFRNEPREIKGIPIEEKELIEKNRNYINQGQPFPWKQIFRNSMLWALFFSYFCIQWANYFIIAWMPNYLQEGKHFSEKQMGTTMTFVAVGGFLAALVFGIFSDWLVRKKGNSVARKSVAIVSFWIMSLVIFISSRATNHALITISFVVASFLLVTIVLTCFATCVEIGGDRVSTLTGIMNFCGQTGAFLMSMIFGKIVDITHSFEPPQFLMAVLLVLAGTCWFKIDASKNLITDPVYVSILQPV
jgi:MFS transporter, ACS family, glucarate transporter